jgi:hypothetical protein
MALALANIDTMGRIANQRRGALRFWVLKKTTFHRIM